jgi:hypothetical protein
VHTLDSAVHFDKCIGPRSARSMVSRATLRTGYGVKSVVLTLWRAVPIYPEKRTISCHAQTEAPRQSSIRVDHPALMSPVKYTA